MDKELYFENWDGSVGLSQLLDELNSLCGNGKHVSLKTRQIMRDLVEAIVSGHAQFTISAHGQCTTQSFTW